MTETKPKRRWLRFSLRTFLILLTLFGVWIGLQVSAAQRQRQAVAAIRNASGSVKYNYDLFPTRGEMSAFNPNPAPPLAPKWLRDRIGEDYFCDVVVVSFHGMDIEEATFHELVKLPALRWVEILRMPRRFTARDLQIIGELRSLRELMLNGQGIEASGIASLVNLPQLKILRMLSVIDDEGMEQLGKLKQVEYLHLVGNRITDAGYKQLQGLTRLNTFVLQFAAVSNQTLRYLKDLPNLKSLELRNCVDSGGQLDGLKQLHQLSDLTLFGSRLSKESIDDLQKALPGMKISVTP